MYSNTNYQGFSSIYYVTAVSTFFLYGRVTFFPLWPCHIFFLYGRVTFFPCRAVSQGVYKV